MNEEEQLYDLMKHAQDLQKIADTSQKELQVATTALKAAVKQLPKEVGDTVSGTVSGLINSRLVEPVDQAGTRLGQIVATIKAATKGLWLYPAVIAATIMVVLSGYTYFGVQWVMDERDRASEELAAINHELAQTANVRKFKTEDNNDQFWVEIDPAQKTGDADGKTWARMPRR